MRRSDPPRIPGSAARTPAPAPCRTFETIWQVVARVPRGRVATYGQIARMAGLPGGARTVGWALRALPDGHRVGGRPVPWHRVINAAGTVSLRGDGEAGAAARQRTRLAREGIAFSAAGLINLKTRLWSGDRRRRRR